MHFARILKKISNPQGSSCNYHAFDMDMIPMSWGPSTSNLLKIKTNPFQKWNPMGERNTTYQFCMWKPNDTATYLRASLLSSSELSELLSELETVRFPQSIACLSSNVNFCRRSGWQQQHCQLVVWTSGRHSGPIFLFIHVIQNKVLHDLQFTKSLLLPHQPQ